MLTLVGVQEPFIIPINTAVSNSIKAKGGINGNMMVYGKTVTDGAITYIYQGSDNNVDWYDLVDSAAAAVIPPLEGKAKSLTDVPVYVRIKANSNVSAARTWHTSAEL